MSFFSIFNKLKLFDVTLSNGSRLNKYTLSYKKNLLKKILYETTPHKLEIGLFNPSLNYTYTHKHSAIKSAQLGISVQSDTVQLYNFTQKMSEPSCQFYVLMPLQKLYIEQAQTLHINNISIMTAVSDTFLQKYTNRPLQSTKTLLTKLFATDEQRFSNVKLYVACVTYCPFEGSQKIHKIIQDILYYNALPGISEICLADTCGTLQYTDFRKIIEGLAMQMDLRKLSVRLAMKKSFNEQLNLLQDYNIAQIIQYCIQNNIYQFDAISEDTDKYNDKDKYKDKYKDTCKLLHYDTLYDNIEDNAELAYYA
jgi:hypothetical protein